MKAILIIKLLLSFIGGIIITIITGLLPYPSEGVIGSYKWSYSFYWLSQAIYPGAEKKI